MIKVDISSGVCEISGERKKVLLEYSILVSSLKFDCDVPMDEIVTLSALAMVDDSLIKGSKKFGKKDLTALMNELMKMKKENDEKEEKEKENE